QNDPALKRGKIIRTLQMSVIMIESFCWNQSQEEGALTVLPYCAKNYNCDHWSIKYAGRQ
ncbi:hypothetical protein, partial [Novacetimonas hansenii]|uniref:hypothetical protein n=1 Tax=Novacetimonas hansenii TaxID=436 RepID=UPI00222F3539